MTGPVDTSQSKPLDEERYRHHLLLLKSMHCARPVIFEDRNEFIQGLTINHEGSYISMLVYLTGKRGGIDGENIQIKHDVPATAKEAPHE